MKIIDSTKGLLSLVRIGLVAALMAGGGFSPAGGATEECDPGTGQALCDGLDSDCDGVVDQCSTRQFLPPVGRSALEDDELWVPTSVDVDASGNVYTVDWTQQIKVFGVDGLFRFAFGEPGDGPGQLVRGNSIHVAPDGTLYVVDLSKPAILNFSAEGSLLREWDGAGGPGALITPWAVVADADGNVYVSDLFRDEIVKFDSQGNFVTSWGGPGAAPGQLRNPRAMAFGPEGTLFVAESSNFRVQEFDANGTLINLWGGSGNGPGQFLFPWLLTIDDAGAVYVLDVSPRLQKFDADGQFLDEIPLPGSSFFEGLAFENDLFLADANRHVITRLDRSGTPLNQWGAPDAAPGELLDPLDVAAGDSGTLYVANRGFIAKLAADGSPLDSWNVPSDTTRLFQGEYLAADSAENVFVTDWNQDRVLKFDSSGNFLLEWRGQETDPLSDPLGIATDAMDRVFVADSRNFRVQVFDSSGGLLDSWPIAGVGSARVRGLSIDADGNVYLADDALERVLKYTVDGVFLTSWGSLGEGPGEFIGPRDVEVVGDRLFVADATRLQEFDLEGAFVAEYATGGTPLRGLGSDRNGILHAADLPGRGIRRVGCAQLGTWFPDADRDTFGVDAATGAQCGPPSGFTDRNADCDDQDPRVNPLALERCDGIDNDCDLAVDEEFAGDDLDCGQDASGCPTGTFECIDATPVCVDEIPPPTCGGLLVDPSALVAVAPAGESVVEPLQLTNVGSVPLQFEIEVRPPQSCRPTEAFVSSFLGDRLYRVDLETGEFDEILSSFRPNNGLELSRDGRRLYYVLSSSSGGVRVLDLRSDEVSRLGEDFDFQGPVGLALSFDESTLYVSEDLLGRIQAIDLATDSVTQVAANLSGVQGLALNSAETHLYAVSSLHGLWEIELSTGNVRAIRVSGFLSKPFDLALSADDTTAYVSENGSGEISAIDVESGATTLVATGLPGPDGVALDPLRDRLFVAANDFGLDQGGLFAVDLTTGEKTVLSPLFATGVAPIVAQGCEAEFLDVVPATGLLAPLTSLPFEAVFDSLDLFAGIYAADVVVSTDDLITGSVVIPATFTVTGSPDLAVSPAALDFAALFVGATQALELTLTNDGVDRLVVGSIAAGLAEFVPSETQLELEPLSSTTIEIRFTPSSAALFDGVLTIDSNDPDDPVLTVRLQGEGLPAPEIRIEPGSIEANLQPGSSDTRVVRVSNPGGADLEFHVVAAPGPPVAGRQTVCRPDQLLVVSNMGELVSIDATTGQIGPAVDTGAVFGVTVHPAQTRAYVAGAATAPMKEVSLVDGSVRSLGDDLNNLVAGLSFDRSGRTLYATELDDDALAAVDPQTGTVNRVAVDLDLPFGVEANTASGAVYLTARTGRLYRVDVATGDRVELATGLTRIDVGLVVDREETTAWVTRGLTVEGQISRVDLQTGSVEPFVTGLSWPSGLAVEGQTAWVATVGGQVARVDLTNGQTDTLVSSGSWRGLALTCSTFVEATPVSGVIPPGGSLDVEVSLSAADLESGEYAGLLTFVNNDPTVPEKPVPVYLTVSENRPPVANAGTDFSPECTSPAGALVLLDASASTDPDSTPDTNDDIVSFEWFEDFGLPTMMPLGSGEILDVVLGLGVHDLTLQVADAAGAVALDAVQVSVVDRTPPLIELTVSPELLWPPNHRMVDVEATVLASDQCSDPTIVLASVESDEPDDGQADGSTVADIRGVDVGTADFAVGLRAERAATGDGRVYTLIYVATDPSGNAAEASAIVSVPHDQAGVVDPIEVTLQESAAGTVLRWTGPESALAYDVIRADLGTVHDDGLFIDLGNVTCIESGSTDRTTAGLEDPALPPSGSAFAYLVQYRDPAASSYGSPSADRPRIAWTTGCR